MVKKEKMNLRLKKKIPRLRFCIGVAPVINPQLRKQMLQQLPASVLTLKLKQVIRATPSFRKIYNKVFFLQHAQDQIQFS